MFVILSFALGYAAHRFFGTQIEAKSVSLWAKLREKVGF